jgi:hypothetical protein
MLMFRQLTMILLLTLAACTSSNNKRQSENPGTALSAHQETADAALRNLTPLPSLLFTGSDQSGDYYSLGTKATFAIGANGQLRLLETTESEPMPAANDLSGEVLSYDCHIFGAVANQQTTW